MASTEQIITQPRDEIIERQPLTPTQLVWRRFRRHKMAMFGMILLILLIVYVIGGSFAFSEDYANCSDSSILLQAPSTHTSVADQSSLRCYKLLGSFFKANSWGHPFGLDAVGRDILARTIYGGQISLLIGLAAVVVALVVGITIGAISGYYGGLIDGILMRFTEAMLCIPQLFLLIVAAKYLGDKLHNFQLFGREFSGSVIVIITIIGLDSWMYLARIVRSQFLSLKESEFVMAARCTGTSNLAIIAYHILPNTAAPIIVNATLGVASAILTEAYISFLGLGVRQPTATWGNMLEDATRYLENAPWLWFFPGLLILLTVLAINFVGDGLRDALDPRTHVE
jgi:peptide/nickel transport system permease protein